MDLWQERLINRKLGELEYLSYIKYKKLENQNISLPYGPKSR